MDSGSRRAITLKDLRDELQCFGQSLVAQLQEQPNLVSRQNSVSRGWSRQWENDWGTSSFKVGALSVNSRLSRSKSSKKLINPAILEFRRSESSFWAPSMKHEASASFMREEANAGRTDDMGDDNQALPGPSLVSPRGVAYSHGVLLTQPVQPGMALPLDDTFAGLGIIEPVRPSPRLPWRINLKLVVESALFEQICAVIVLLNAFSVGYDTNQMATHSGGPNKVTTFFETFFCCLFTTELCLRLVAFGKRFFWMDGWRWNYLDAVLVSAQLFEQVLMAVEPNYNNDHVHLGHLRLFRLLRIVRILRLVRAFHLFDDLRVILTSVSQSISSLLWSMVLLFILIYIFSIVFLQCIVHHGRHTKHSDVIHYWFSSLARTLLTMFECLVGGVSWDEVIAPIVEDISPVLGVIFCVYIAACLFAMMNLLTGIFVEKAMMTVREDKDHVLAGRIRDLFLEQERHGFKDLHDEVTWEIFSQKLGCQAMREYFAQINVDISEAKSLFELMDSDGSGSLSSREIVASILRLRGPARALEIAILMKEVSEMYSRTCAVEQGMQQLLLRIQ